MGSWPLRTMWYRLFLGHHPLRPLHLHCSSSESWMCQPCTLVRFLHLAPNWQKSQEYNREQSTEQRADNRGINQIMELTGFSKRHGTMVWRQASMTRKEKRAVMFPSLILDRSPTFNPGNPNRCWLSLRGPQPDPMGPWRALLQVGQGVASQTPKMQRLRIHPKMRFWMQGLHRLRRGSMQMSMETTPNPCLAMFLEMPWSPQKRSRKTWRFLTLAFLTASLNNCFKSWTPFSCCCFGLKGSFLLHPLCDIWIPCGPRPFRRACCKSWGRFASTSRPCSAIDFGIFDCSCWSLASFT